jgi:hypothetical protein
VAPKYDLWHHIGLFWCFWCHIGIVAQAFNHSASLNPNLLHTLACFKQAQIDGIKPR